MNSSIYPLRTVKLKPLTFFILFFAYPAFAKPCEILIHGGDHLRADSPVEFANLVDVIGKTVSEPPKVGAHFVDTFVDTEFEAALAAAGMGESEREIVILRIADVAEKIFTQATTARFLHNGFTGVTNSPDPRETLINICVMDKACSEFDSGKIKRPFLNVGTMGGVHVQDILKPVLAKSSFRINTVVLRAGEGPEEFLADLFSGLGAAAGYRMLELWGQTRLWDPHVEDDELFAKFGRMVDGQVLLDIGFVEFMRAMAAHFAYQEYVSLVPTSILAQARAHPGRYATLDATLDGLSEGAKTYLFHLGIARDTAEQVFMEIYNYIHTTLNHLDRRKHN